MPPLLNITRLIINLQHHSMLCRRTNTGLTLQVCQIKLISMGPPCIRTIAYEIEYSENRPAILDNLKAKQSWACELSVQV